MDFLGVFGGGRRAFILTGDYYVGDVSYGYIYRDKKYQAYHIKEGRLRHRHHNGREWGSNGSPWTARRSPDITKYSCRSASPGTRAARKTITWAWTWRRNF